MLPLLYAYNSEVGTYTPYYTGQTQVQPNSMGYDISADYVVSTTTTTYDTRPGLDALSDNGSLMANVVTTGNKILISIFLMSK
ncbi:hypothetical protein NQ314_014860 [Rhamnusium bicolor]|uniref:Uncharacterized protein n=1 Tax=Rhamnusium bicolor TaxID=1586634 RepID=A0AAV8X0X3_9CUCU|nr:hypothetical protein NQ314_014860 [Rhamnusium bicolor]